MIRHLARPLILGALGALAACSSVPPGAAAPDLAAGADSGDLTEADGPDLARERYRLANRCYALSSVPSGRHLVKQEGRYRLAAPAAVAEGTPLHFKPSGLGTYLVHAVDGELLAVSGDKTLTALAVGGVTPGADWELQVPAPGQLTLTSLLTGQVLSVDDDDRPVLAAAGADGPAERFSFVETTGCTEFPEAELNVSGEVFKGPPAGGPVIGMADSHVHLSAYDAFGGAFYGAPFHRHGITAALEDCRERHGEGGRQDLVASFLGQGSGHETVGWPTFKDWPHREALTHHATYYRWVERAWRAGLRLMVNHLVENEAFCRLVGGGDRDDCNEMVSAKAQVLQMRELQDYIDAQNGGPGEGWLRLVSDPGQARQVIAQGKLAVVLGIETSHLFDCALLDGKALCDEDLIDRHLEELWELGVRAYFPVHEFDNALGGSGIFNVLLDLGNRTDTGSLWEKVPCPAGPYFYDAGAVFSDIDPDRPLCNARTLTPLGRYAISKLMERRAIIELDHMEVVMKGQVLDLALAEDPPYPLVSAHGGHGGITTDQATQIFESGGLIFPYKGNGRDYVSDLQRTLAVSDKRYYFGFGFGVDSNGLGTQASPRPRPEAPVQYPFTLFSGSGFGPELQGLGPVTFDRQRTGNRTYDTDRDGLAHYGLLPDFVEEVRLEGGEEAIRQLYRSAEAYLQMWERVTGR